jgi:UDP-N-acetylmuramoyl-L-alanyl-D-glutamate--2,6-diaminopimelate ligase
VVPADDDFGLAIGREIELRGGRVLRFGRSQDADYRVLACDWSRDTAEVELATPDGALSVVTPLPGNHNALNVAAAFAACEALGVDRETAADAFREAEPVAGRWDVQDEGQPFDAIVDYAHNPDGVVRVLEAARRLADARGSSVRTVIAAGGGNDASKRPAMGYQARHLSDQVIVTSGNSRGEAVSIVADGVMSGAERADGGALESVLDRRGAIRRALECAEPGDVVLVLGRGAMPRLLASTSGDGRPFDDRAVLREELHRLRQNAKAHPVGSA